MHIMLVEDDSQVSAYASRGFTQAGHVVDVLENGVWTIELLGWKPEATTI